MLRDVDVEGTMTNATRNLGIVLLTIGFAVVFEAGTALSADLPKVEAILGLARQATFDPTAVTDDPVPAEIQALNPDFRIRVYFRAGADEIEFPADVGAIFARVEIKGVPKERQLPDGTYYLWIGGAFDSLRAVLAKVDGSFSREVEVRSAPGLAAATLRHARTIHAVVDPPRLSIAAVPGVPGTPQPRPTWREICVTPRPVNHGPGGGKKWIRVPDN